MKILKIAAFSHNGMGGNPAGVVFCDEMPTEKEMLRTAKDVGYSETAFLRQIEDGWRIRYFSPELEVPFCGHATIASGAALGGHSGEGDYKLFLNDNDITIRVEKSKNNTISVALQSPDTWSEAAPQEFVDKILASFHLTSADLNSKFPIRVAFAGAKHLIIVLNNRKTLTKMNYAFDTVKSLMLEKNIVTINLLYNASESLFYSRNAFAYGGVIEDPATGAAAAALGGYLRDIEWQGENRFEVLQGEDMGVPSRLLVEYGSKIGEGVIVKGSTRNI
jgi:PhzF family phenazine biosynthesis protein